MREINWDKPLSKDDRAWLEQRLTPDLSEQVAANDKRFAGGKDASVSTEATFEDDYDKWKVEELKAECEGREPPIDIAGLTKKAEFVAALRTWDVAHPDAEEA